MATTNTTIEYLYFLLHVEFISRSTSNLKNNWGQLVITNGTSYKTS